MSLQILATKLYIPAPQADLVLRPRLMERLNRGLSRKLALVSAPAGFGKTTMVAQWLREIDHPYAWLSLDAGDNDPVRFLTYVITALQKLDEAIGRGLLHSSPAISAARGAEGSEWIESLLTILVNDIAAAADGSDYVLVLDDYHLIHHPLIQAAIGFIIAHQPPNLHLVLTTRVDPPLNLSRLRVRRQVVEIRQADLKFTPEETARFLNQTRQLSLSPAAIQTLEARTEGWIAGLQLASLAMQARLTSSDKQTVAAFIEAFGGSNRYVIDYLVEEVIAQQADDMRGFLRQTAILDHLTAPLCDAISGRDDSKTILAHLEQANLFLIPLDEQRVWYRYHHLFTEFLRTELMPQAQTLLHRRAAGWFEANGYPAEAIKHALAAKDVGETRRLIGAVADNVFLKGELATLLGWLDALPDDVVRANSDLATYKGWALWLTGQGQGAESYAQAAETSLPGHDPAAIRGKLISLRACLTLTREDATQALRLLQDALDRLDETTPFFRGITLLILGEAQTTLGETAGAVETLRQAIQLGEQYGDHFMTVGATVNLVELLNVQGKRRAAVAICQDALERYVDDQGNPLSWVGPLYVALGMLAYEANDLRQAQTHLQRGLDLNRQQSMMGVALSDQLALAKLQSAWGQSEAALATVQEMYQIMSQATFDAYMVVFAALEAGFQLQRGNLAAVEAWAKEANYSPGDSPPPLLEPAYLTYVRLLLAQNRPAEAQQLLDKLEQAAAAGGRQLILIAVTILQALSQVALNDEQAALATLEKALRLAEPESYRRVFLNEGPPLARLLPKARHLMPRFIDGLLDALAQQERVSPRSPAPPLPCPPAPHRVAQQTRTRSPPPHRRRRYQPPGCGNPFRHRRHDQKASQ